MIDVDDVNQEEHGLEVVERHLRQKSHQQTQP